jgi:isopentenyldiphosphate isomerase
MCCVLVGDGLQCYHKEAVILATRRQNITIDSEVYEKFIEIANTKGIKLSPWVNAQMQQFIEQEERSKESKE